MVGLVLTNDWELYGDGSGDYYDVQHRPLGELLRAAEDHGAVVTVMAEVGQQWAFLELKDRIPGFAGISEAWEEMLRGAVSRGHDVQLHLHPQWLGYRLEGDRFRLDLERWTLASLGATNVGGVVRRGRDYLEGLLMAERPGYRCLAFRAGSYCIEPAGEVIPGLKAAGIVIDSSVSRGLRRIPHYDFRRTPSAVRPWWTSRTSVVEERRDHVGLLEMPIYCEVEGRSALLARLWPGIHRVMKGEEAPDDEDVAWQRARSAWVRERYEGEEEVYVRWKEPWIRRWSKRLYRREAVQLDYDKLHPSKFVAMLERAVALAEREASRHGLACVPVVAVGHAKNEPDARNLARILALADRRLGNRVRFMGFQEAAVLCGAALGGGAGSSPGIGAVDPRSRKVVDGRM